MDEGNYEIRVKRTTAEAAKEGAALECSCSNQPTNVRSFIVSSSGKPSEAVWGDSRLQYCQLSIIRGGYRPSLPPVQNYMKRG